MPAIDAPAPAIVYSDPPSTNPRKHILEKNVAAMGRHNHYLPKA